MYITRCASDSLARYLSVFPAVGITGPRQSGKSTLLQHALPNYQYVSFDDLQNVERFQHDPVNFMQQQALPVIFDEVQFVPEIFHWLKIAIDKHRQDVGRFVLTGSSQFSYLRNISESLAGRIGLMTLLPLQFSEMPSALQDSSVYQGGYPELVLRDFRESNLWYSSYLDTYVNKDVRSLSNIGDMREFRQFISLLAAQASQVFDQSYFARELGVSLPTIKRWISILEASYIVFLLPPFHRNLGKRIIKRPKIYFYDTGLVSYLTGVKTQQLYEQGPMAGAIFENYIISEVKKRCCHLALDVDLYYFRTSDQAEIDLIIDHRDRQSFIEIKKSATFSPRMLTHLKRYGLEKHARSWLVYNGREFVEQENLTAINYRDFLSRDDW